MMFLIGIFQPTIAIDGAGDLKLSILLELAFVSKGRVNTIMKSH